jgi:hypothetical protein
MAQAKRKRTRKHRGNAAGIVERPAHNSRGTTSSSSGSAKRRPMTKEETRAEARRRRQERLSKPPTWKGAAQRAAVAAVLFAVLVTVVLKQPVSQSIPFAVIMLALYVPLSYLTDRAIYNWRQKKGTLPRG